MTEIDKLTSRLFDRPGRTHIGFSVSWGPDAHLLTPEQRAAELNRVMDAIERGDYEPMPLLGDSKRQKTDIAEFVKTL
jgi:hypothetical protein